MMSLYVCVVGGTGGQGMSSWGLWLLRLLTGIRKSSGLQSPPAPHPQEWRKSSCLSPDFLQDSTDQWQTPSGKMDGVAAAGLRTRWLREPFRADILGAGCLSPSGWRDGVMGTLQEQWVLQGAQENDMLSSSAQAYVRV